MWVSDDVSWYVERQFGAYGELRDNVFRTAYSIPRLVISWALGLRQHARIEGPPELVDEARERIDRIVEQHRGDAPPIPDAPPPVALEIEDQRAQVAARRRPRSDRGGSRGWSRSRSV